MYCVYLRKSRKDLEAEKSGQGDTLARHEAQLIALAKRMGLTVEKIYREVVSGETIAARPQMQALLHDIEARMYRGVLVMEVERLARGDTIDQGIVAQTFKYSDTQIITPAKIYQPNDEFDEEYFEFGLFMSRREYKTINRRMQNGRLASVREGKYVGSVAPYGYRRIKLANCKGFTLEPEPDEAPIVKQVFHWYVYGSEGRRLGVSLIARRLNEMRIPARNGPDWMPATIRGIIGNPVYIGKVAWGRRPTRNAMEDGVRVTARPRAETYLLADGLHAPIISNELFHRAQSLLKENAPAPLPEKRAMSNPLSGLMVCGVCGRKMVRRPYANGRPAALVCTATVCGNVSAPFALVERRVLEAVDAWVNTLKVTSQNKAISNGKADLQAQLCERLKRELAELHRQRDSAFRAFERGVYTDDVFLERSRAIADQLGLTAAALERAERELLHRDSQAQAQTHLIPRAEQLLRVYERLETAQEKNILIKGVLEKVVYTKSVNGRWHGSPGDFTIRLYPLIAEH